MAASRLSLHRSALVVFAAQASAAVNASGAHSLQPSAYCVQCGAPKIKKDRPPGGVTCHKSARFDF
jgi:hypothetical protein